MRRLRGPALVVLSALILAGFGLSYWTLAQADLKMREEMVCSARLVADAIDTGEMQSLRFDANDISRPQFIHIREHMREFSRSLHLSWAPANDFVSIYSIQVHGKTFHFGPESIPESDRRASVPGTVYREPPQALRNAIAERQAVTTGPFTDEYGTFVSAFAPMVDPKTGRLVAVLGMDVVATDWYWSVLERAAGSLAIIFILLIAIAVILVSAKPVVTAPRPVLKRLLLPVSTMIIALLAGGLLLIWKQEQQRLATKIEAQKAVVCREFQVDLRNHASLLSAAVRPIAADSGVRTALSKGDIAGLLPTWRPIFEELRKRNHITHFYFHGRNRVCLLRLHTPERRGDVIDRFTLLEAQRTGESACGVELGPLGNLALRAVQPVFDNGTLVGYVELGKEIEDVLQARQTGSELELAVSIRKRYLSRPDWESSMRLLGREADWDHWPESVTVYTSDPRLRNALDLVVDRNAPGEHNAHGNHEITSHGNFWHVSQTPLNDAAGKNIGELLVFIDTTAERTAFARLVILGGTIGAVLAALLLGFMYVLLRRTDEGIRIQQAELRASEEHLSATLRSIGDGVITCDSDGNVVSLNAVAESITGWTNDDARGRAISQVLRIVHTDSRQDAEIPVGRVLREDRIVELAGPATLITPGGSERQIADSCAPIHSADGRIVGAVLVFRDVTEEYHQREQLRESNARFDQLAAQSRVVTWEVDSQGLFTYISAVAEVVLGYTSKEIVDRLHFYDLVPEPQRDCFKTAAFTIFERKEPFRDLVHTFLSRDGRELSISTNGIPLFNADGTLRGYRGTDTDVTERVWADRYREMTSQVLQILSEPGPLPAAIQRFVAVVKASTEFDAIGVRLQNGDDFPYAVQEGFPPEFVSTEDSLVICDSAEAPCRDCKGDVQLACTCGLVISGKTDRRSPLFTPGGSFWTNDSSSLLDLPPAEDPRLNPRNLCIHEGYASVALVPIRNEDQIVGLLQLNDGRKGRFSQSTIEQLEAIAAHLGEALMRHKAEEALRESEARLRGIAESAQDAILMIDPQGAISYWNPAAENILGYSAQEAMGRSLHELLAPERFLNAHRQAFAKFGCTGQGNVVGKTVELAARRKDGLEIAVALSLSAVQIGGAWHGVGIVRDITAQKLAEQELIETNNRLEVATARANEMAAQAEIANAAKSEFLANMSHEIRTPMTAILGYAEVIGETCQNQCPAGEELQHAVDAIQRNSRHLLEIINDILDISKIEADKMTTEEVACSVQETVTEVTSILRVRAESKGLLFDTEFVGLVPERIQTDPLRLRQVLINLLGNAIKFTNTGSVKLLVRLVNESTPSRMQFDVVDTGTGMTADQVERIFQPFSQADSSTTRQFGGTGLGLTISKKLARLLGGDVVLVESRPGWGTQFRATVATGPLEGVRLVEGDASQPAFTRRGEIANAPDKNSADALGGVHILLAEDGVDNQRLIAHVLKKAGATLEMVDNGRSAVQMAFESLHAGRPFDVILMDMQMPDVDGYEATAELRAADYRGPIIALTAHAMAGDQRKCLEAGCDDYATKPIDRNRLIATIQKQALNRRNPEHKTGDVLISDLSTEPDLAELLDAFVSQLPERANSLQRACQEQNTEALARLTHQLKGAAGGYGFPAITAAATNLEMSIKAQQNWEKLAQDLAEVVALCSKARSRPEADDANIDSSLGEHLA